jgi:DNA-directed RNA polymerase specialized sigma24 family protein
MGSLQYHLSEAELDDVIAAAQESSDDNSAGMNEILRRFTPLARRVARSQTDCLHFRNDLVVECLRVAVGATRRHQIGTPGFPSFMENFMRGAASRMAKRERLYIAGPRRTRIHSLNEANLAEMSTGDAVTLDEVVGERVSGPWGGGATARFVDALNVNQKRLVERAYIDELTVKELATEMGVTSSAVSQQIATIHRLARRQLAA